MKNKDRSEVKGVEKWEKYAKRGRNGEGRVTEGE